MENIDLGLSMADLCVHIGNTAFAMRHMSQLYCVVYGKQASHENGNPVIAIRAAENLFSGGPYHIWNILYFIGAMVK